MGDVMLLRVLKKEGGKFWLTYKPGPIERPPPPPKGRRAPEALHDVPLKSILDGQVQGMNKFGIYVLVDLPKSDDEQYADETEEDGPVMGFLSREDFGAGFAEKAEIG